MQRTQVLICTITLLAAAIAGHPAHAQQDTDLSLQRAGHLRMVDGDLDLRPDGSLTYTPDAGFTGTDTFTYFASDGDLSSNLVTVSITVVANGEGEAADNLSPQLLADLALADWE